MLLVRSLIGVLLYLGVLPAAHLRAEPNVQMHIWIKAFIPNTLSSSPGVIIKTDKGTSVIEAPFRVAGIPVGPLSGTCFSTDDRLFSADPGASARVSIEFNVVFKGRRELEVQKYAGKDLVTVGDSHNVDCKSGKDLQLPKKEDVSSVDVGPVKKNGFLRIFNIRASSGNPYYRVPGINIGYAPKIDVETVFEYDALSLSMNIHGVTGVFPAVEAYYSINSGTTKTIIKRDPEPGATPADLLDLGTGINTRNFDDRIDLKPYLLP